MADSFSCQEDLNEMIAEIKAEKMAAGRRRRNSSTLESISENVGEEDLNKTIADVKAEKMATGRRRRNSSTLESISENALAEMIAQDLLPEKPTNSSDTKKKPTKKTFKGGALAVVAANRAIRARKVRSGSLDSGMECQLRRTKNEIFKSLAKKDIETKLII